MVGERIEARAVRDGVVRVEGVRRSPGAGPPAVEVDSSGVVHAVVGPPPP
jgi:hypothetical protein